jgi:hypothetical protein
MRPVMRYPKPRETDAEKIARLEGWVNDLQKGMFINCVYCGHRYGPESEIPASMADVLKRHIAVCPHHPMSKLIETLSWIAGRLRNYQGENAATELAKDMADHIDAILAETLSEPIPERKP